MVLRVSTLCPAGWGIFRTSACPPQYQWWLPIIKALHLIHPNILEKETAPTENETPEIIQEQRGEEQEGAEFEIIISSKC